MCGWSCLVLLQPESSLTNCVLSNKIDHLVSVLEYLIFIFSCDQVTFRFFRINVASVVVYPWHGMKSDPLSHENEFRLTLLSLKVIQPFIFKKKKKKKEPSYDLGDISPSFQA